MKFLKIVSVERQGNAWLARSLFRMADGSEECRFMKFAQEERPTPQEITQEAKRFVESYKTAIVPAPAAPLAPSYGSITPPVKQGFWARVAMWFLRIFWRG
jgi:hypothetical protein